MEIAAERGEERLGAVALVGGGRVEYDLLPERIEVRPESAFAAAGLRVEDRHGCVVGVQIACGRDLATQLRVDRGQRRRDLGHPATHRRARHIDPLPQEDAREPIQRQMIDILRDDHVREQPLARERLLDRLRRRGRFDDALVTLRARVLEAGRLDHAQARRDILQLLRNGFADPRLPVAARTDLVGVWHVDLDALAGQVRGQRVPAGWAASAARPAGPLARVHFDRLGDRAGLVGQLRKREAQLVGTDPFGFLPEESLTEDVQLMAQRRVFPLRPGQLVAQCGDEHLRGGEIRDVRGV